MYIYAYISADPFWGQQAARAFRFLTFWKNDGASLLEIQKIPEQHFDTSQTNGTSHTF